MIAVFAKGVCGPLCTALEMIETLKSSAPLGADEPTQPLPPLLPGAEAACLPAAALLAAAWRLTALGMCALPALQVLVVP